MGGGWGRRFRGCVGCWFGWWCSIFNAVNERTIDCVGYVNRSLASKLTSLMASTVDFSERYATVVYGPIRQISPL